MYYTHYYIFVPKSKLKFVTIIVKRFVSLLLLLLLPTYMCVIPIFTIRIHHIVRVRVVAVQHWLLLLGLLSSQIMSDAKLCRFFCCLLILLCLFSSLLCHLPRTLGAIVKLATHFLPSRVLILTEVEEEDEATTNSFTDDI